MPPGSLCVGRREGADVGEGEVLDDSWAEAGAGEGVDAAGLVRAFVEFGDFSEVGREEHHGLVGAPAEAEGVAPLIVVFEGFFALLVPDEVVVVGERVAKVDEAAFFGEVDDAAGEHLTACGKRIVDGGRGGKLEQFNLVASDDQRGVVLAPELGGQPGLVVVVPPGEARHGKTDGERGEDEVFAGDLHGGMTKGEADKRRWDRSRSLCGQMITRLTAHHAHRA